MSNYNSQLQSNNTDLQTVLQTLQTKAAGGSVDAVLYTEQTLTPEQQAQARKNIGSGTVITVNGIVPDENGNVDLNAEPAVPTYRFNNPAQVILKSYWSVTDTTGTGVAVVRSGADWWATDWCCYSQLIPARPGDILRFYHYPFETYTADQIVFMAYTRDKKAFNGNSGRLVIGHGVDHGDYREFTVPENTAYVALDLLYKGDESVLATSYVEHISNSPVPEFVIGDKDTAQMYQKGAAPKSFKKKTAILCAGQSNAQGRVPRDQLPSYVSLPMENCHYCNNTSGNFADLGDQYFVSNQWAFDLITYYNMTQVANEEIYAIKYAMGGTSIDPTGATEYHWTPFYEELDSVSNSLLRTFETMIRACMEKSGSEFDIRAMLWHQGEGDADSVTASAKYYYNLRSMIAYIRGVVGNDQLPFICGTVPHASASYDVTIEAALQQLSEEDPNFYLVDLSNAVMLDSWHFNAAWSEYFGKCAYDCLIDAGVISGEKLNPAEPS
jgi:hypothetical protein